MIRQEEDGYWIVLHETIAAHHEEVFACLTTANGLIRWFPVAAEIELRSGGTVALGWDENMKRKTTVAILDFDAGGRITWDWHAASSEIHAPVYWNVEPDHEQGALVTLRQGPFREKAESLVAMAEEAESWRWQLCNLRTTLEVGLDMRKVRPL